MFKIYSIYFLLFLCSSIFGQSGIVTYLQYDNEGRPNMVKMYFDKNQSMYIYNKGKKERVCKAANGEVIDFNNDEKFAQQMAKYSHIYYYDIDEEGQLVYKNWQSKKLIYREIFKKEVCIINEPNLPNIKWQLLSDRKIIGSFNCQKATTKFRGRDYEAWFTSEIPIPTGPWKLHGLPGLILEASDKSGEYKYIYQSIEMPLKENAQLTKLPTKGTIVELKDYHSFCRKQDEDMKREVESKAAARGQSVTVTLSTKPKQEINYE